MNETRAVTGIVIDAGNGGEDTGTVANGITEKNINLEVSQYMKDRFQELGVPVALTRESDETLAPNDRVTRILEAFGNGSDVIVLSNQLNSGGGSGAEVVYALRNSSDLAEQILTEIGREGQEITKYYQRRWPENPSRDYYQIQRETEDTQPVIIRYGYADNVEDANRLKQNVLNYAEGVVRAVSQYAGIRYVPPATSTKEYYTVQRGDSLYSIASRYGVTVSALREANNLTTDVLQIGQILIIPGQGSSGETPPNEGGTISTYTVRSGDSLWSIASRYGISVEELRNANNLTSDVLQIGQVLRIPNQGTTPPPSGGTTYTVQRGDSLWSIATRFNTTVAELKRQNNLTSDALEIGQVLVIPASSSGEESTTSRYTVQSGDSLWSIAKKFNTTVDEIKRLNGLSNNSLRIGQTLLIPTSGGSGTQNYITYTVKRDDSLWTIANRYGTTVNEIKTLNGLSSNALEIGQQLKIPV